MVAERTAQGSSRAESIWSPLEAAILRAVVYSDLFDQPLRVEEVHRYLPLRAELAAVRQALAPPRPLGGALERSGELVHLAGRAAIVAIRQRRQAAAAARWRAARAWGRRLAAIPFVRLVAVTGALAVDNSEANDDLDFFIATEPGRLWLARAGVIGLVYAARCRGLELCPNYFLSTRALAQPERSSYAAREAAQMVPLYGRAAYHDFRAANPWLAAALPNATLHDPGPAVDRLGRLGRWKQKGERLLGGHLGDAMERLERARKVRRLAAARDGYAGAKPDWVDRSQFDADHCKGHFDNHGARTLRAYTARLAALGLAPDEPPTASAALPTSRRAGGR